jgi:hypothetical protein
MNIHAKKGDIVFVTEKTINSGYDHDSDLAKKYLEIGKPYTVDHTEVDGWHTDVYLSEIPNIGFNSVNFVDENDFVTISEQERITSNKTFKEFEISACINIDSEMTEEEFTNKFINMIESNNMTIGGTIRGV